MIDFDALVTAPCMATFGEDPEQRPTYTAPGAGASIPIDGVFDDAFSALTVNDDGKPEIATTMPVIGVRLAQFGATPPVQDGVVHIPRTGVTYLVSNVEPDGRGWALLRLTEKA